MLEDEQEFPPADPNTDTPTMTTYKAVFDEFKEVYYVKRGNDKGWKPIIADRMTAIETMYDSLTTDKDEIAYITPDDLVDVPTALANKTQSFKTGEEGLKGMDNQSKIVPYCPSY